MTTATQHHPADLEEFLSTALELLSQAAVELPQGETKADLWRALEDFADDGFEEAKIARPVVEDGEPLVP